jgi:tetratricopeptide (TPR) repeat protein
MPTDPRTFDPTPLAARGGLVRLMKRYAGWWLSALVLVVYLPSIPGDVLVYDDTWLVENNPVLRYSAAEAVHAIFFDLGLDTRLLLGAEYLPLRDASYWIDTELGFGPAAMRAEQLLIYLGAVLLLRAALLVNMRSRAVAEVASLCFALHPVHVESVAWLAGRKDVLALFFVAAALRTYEASGVGRWATIPLLLGAHFSKSMSLIGGALLLGQDLLAQRRPRWGLLSASALGALLAFAVHRSVGMRVGMLGGPLSGDAWAVWGTMGHVWLRYLEALFWPPILTLTPDDVRQTSWDLGSVLGWGAIAGGLAVGVFLLRRGRPLVLTAWLWFAVPLAPVSQVLVPLQNVMADRYLWLSVLGLGLLLGAAWQASRAGAIASAAALGVWLIGSAWRASLFGDGVALFERETRVSRGALAPFLLAVTHQRRGDVPAAERAYRTALERPCGSSCDPIRQSSNALARLLVHDGRPAEAEPILRAARQRFPEAANVAFNLVKVLYRLGRVDEAEALYIESTTRFPEYRSNESARFEQPGSVRGLPPSLGTP